MTKPELLDDFTVAYRARLEENRPSLELWAALVKLTNFADHPVDLDQLAATLKGPHRTRSNCCDNGAATPSGCTTAASTCT